MTRTVAEETWVLERLKTFRCSECEGSGSFPGAFVSRAICKACDGSGYKRQNTYQMLEHIIRLEYRLEKLEDGNNS